MLNVAFIQGRPRNKMDLKEVNIFFAESAVFITRELHNLLSVNLVEGVALAKQLSKVSQVKKVYLK